LKVAEDLYMNIDPINGIFEDEDFGPCKSKPDQEISNVYFINPP